MLPLTNQGTVRGFDVGRSDIVYALDILGDRPNCSASTCAPARWCSSRITTSSGSPRSTLGEYLPFSFRGWNDEPVHGYIVKPVGYLPGRKYPVVLLIHGGPESSLANEFHYRWNAQTYAGAGFAVVMIDFHGSTGYGQAFTDSIRGHWGDRPLEDLQKGWSYALGELSVPRRRARLRAWRQLRWLPDQLDRRQLATRAAAAVEVPGHARWRVRQPHDVLQQ